MTDQLKNTLNRYLSQIKNVSLSSLTGLTTNLQNARSTDIAFYRIRDVKGVEAFKERDKKAKPGLILLTGMLKLGAKGSRAGEKGRFASAAGAH